MKIRKLLPALTVAQMLEVQKTQQYAGNKERCFWFEDNQIKVGRTVFNAQKLLFVNYHNLAWRKLIASEVKVHTTCGFKLCCNLNHLTGSFRIIKRPIEPQQDRVEPLRKSKEDLKREKMRERKISAIVSRIRAWGFDNLRSEEKQFAIKHFPKAGLSGLIGTYSEEPSSSNCCK